MLHTLKKKISRLSSALLGETKYPQSQIQHNASSGKKISLDQLQLISIHIPKSAGTSFRNILLDQYGEGLKRIDIPGNNILSVEEQRNFNPSLLTRLKVAHGHFSIERFNQHFDYNKEVPIITWLRNPVDRVMSNYYYLSSVLHGLIDEKKYPALLPRLERNLLEFAEFPRNRNRICDFIGTMSLDDFRFVGVMEYFEEDLSHLAELLAWKKFKVYRHNKTKNKASSMPEEEVISAIENINQKDMRLYAKALEMREARLALSS